ncbi:serine threonine kinase [Fusarium agapanthi]|uniref:Serine threonine kinase n=1 Tax=Fusarium agapanthi TaxID=1803897 RepID=A0A9P5BAM3_9HYPO|nr:serine threonine kinase [Fusarium agapanthi]
MPEVEYADYQLYPWVFQDWLRYRFSDDTIQVEVANPLYFEQEIGYVSISSLKDYWTNARIHEVVKSCLIEADIDQIAERFLRIFSLLVQVGRHGDIKTFLERDLDDETFASPGLSHERMTEFSDVFKKHWSFFPVEFKSHPSQPQELLSRQILPITYYESFKQGNRRFEAALYKVQIGSDYCDLVPKDTPLVFKIYRGVEMRQDYHVETDNYSNLNGKAQHAITKCYGSFSCEETDFRVIILEYASEGSLRSFFRNTHSPLHVEEVRELWVNLVGLLDGLDALHTCRDSKPGIHKDIKPDNILVFPESSESRFNVRFKLADFHVTEFKLLDREGKMMINNWGSRLYMTDEVSPAIGHMILNFMMTNEKERLRAVEIKSLMQSITKMVQQTNSSTYEAQVVRIRQSRIEESSPIITTSSDHIGMSDTSSLRLWSDPEHTAGDTSLSTAPNTRDSGSGHKNQKGDPRTIEVYGYEIQLLHGDMETEDQEEIQSLVSPDDDIESLQSGTTPLRVYQIASKLLVERFLHDDRLLSLYQQAVKRLYRTRFVNNHKALMKQYFLDLRAAARSRTEEISVDFLRSRKERIRISSVIYDLVLKQGEQVRAKVKMEIEDNQESILTLDHFLAGHDDATCSNSESSEESDDLPPQQKQTSQGGASKVEAAAIFMTVGSAFDAYKYNLDEFLHPKKLESDCRKAIEPPLMSSEDRSPTPVGSQDASKNEVVVPSVVRPKTGPAAVETSYYFAKKLAKGLSCLMKITRSRVKEGYRRLEWTCDCGSQLYADFIVLDEERFQRFAELLQSPPSESSQETIADVQSSQGSSSREQETSMAYRDSPNTNSHIMSSSTAQHSGTDTSSKAMPPPGAGRGQEACLGESPESKSRYLALCVQTGPIYATLEEFDTSSFKSDAALLEEMKNVYTRIRGVWNSSRPDSVPPKSQLEYDYDPKPLDFLPPMPPQVFLHYLEHGEGGWNKFRYLWLPKLPVRRDKRIIEGHEASYGWGIHIIEGPNRWAIFALLVITVLGSALAALLCIVVGNANSVFV